MAVRVSRRKLASHVAEQLHRGASSAIPELAAFLVDNGRTHEADLLVRDIEVELAKRGTVVATVTSAQPLTDQARSDVSAVIRERYGADADVRLKEIVDPTILGGVKISTPREELDASVRRALTNLKASNIKE